MRRFIVTVTTVVLFAGGAGVDAQERTDERTGKGPGVIEVAGFPVGGMFFTGSSDRDEPEFGAYALGASLTVNLNPFVGLEGEFGNAVGVHQSMTFQDRLLKDQRGPSLYAYTGNLVINPIGNARAIVPYATAGLGGMSLVDHEDTRAIGVDKTSHYFAGNVGGGVKWFAHRYFGLRGDYRLVMVNDRVTAPEFFGRREVRYGHRVYGGLIFMY
jgi:hypothetical protein